jgi:hypothetical protein
VLSVAKSRQAHPAWMRYATRAFDIFAVTLILAVFG